MVTRLGMSERIGPVSVAQRNGNEFLGGEFSLGREQSEALSTLIDQEVRRILDEADERAHTLLTTERHRLEALAEALLREESLDADQLLRRTGLSAKTQAGKVDHPIPPEPALPAPAGTGAPVGGG